MAGAMETILYLTVTSLLLTTVASYTNHTVGGKAGWFFDLSTNTSSTDFPKWAASQTFNLGDFIIFNTNTNQTVIQTYNQTVYESCSSDDASDTDTFVYSGGNEIGKALTFSVPLTIEGPNYYFSGTDDGVQCANGMGFKIVVKRGSGLPPSLNQPPPPPYVEPPSSDSNPMPDSNPTGATNQQQDFYKGGSAGNGADFMGLLGVGLMVLFGLLL